MIYLNAAGHGLPDSSVRQRMIRHLQCEEDIGVAAAEAEAAEECAAVRGRLAALIGAEEAEVALMPWGTAAWNAAVLSLPLQGKRVLAAPGEWASNIALMTRLGARVECMPLDPTGRIDLTALANRIDSDVAALACPTVASLTGECYPVEAIGALPRPETCAFIVDASQSLGVLPISVERFSADILSAPTRKWLRGPKGTGVLYVRQRWLAQMQPSLVADYMNAPFRDGAFTDCPDARRFEQTGFFVAQRLGLSAALDVLDGLGPENVASQIAGLTSHTKARAAEASIEIAGAEPVEAGIVTLRMPRSRLDAVLPKLRDAGITVKDAGPECEPLRSSASIQGGFLRVSPHVYNTQDHIDRLFEVIA